MSSPIIPDFTPYIDITTEDAVKLLIKAIEKQVASLDKLIEIQNYGILHVLDDTRYKESAVKDILNINESVDSMIRHIMELQTVLQLMLEKARELVLMVKRTFPKEPVVSQETNDECSSIYGRFEGLIKNISNIFHNRNASLSVFIPLCDVTRRSMQYTVKNEDALFRFISYAHYIKVEEPCYSDRMTFSGTGNVDYKSKNNTLSDMPVDFTLTVWNRTEKITEFRIEITSANIRELNHDSGFVNCTANYQ
ncbi:MAG TPA: hypothetical protein DD733_04150 [Clostridiales bacterium]|nr:hypothetical protein [Eubacteriales bacterium]HBR31257.1 hypothetical protein [Clostridiales bacterium]